MSVKQMIFPIKGDGELTTLEIVLPKKKGYLAKNYLKNISKQISHHYQPIQISGSSKKISSKRSSKNVLDMSLKEAEEITMEKLPYLKNAGNWLFGTKKYPGNITVQNHQGKTAYIKFPKSSPQHIHHLINQIKAKVEKG